MPWTAYAILIVFGLFVILMIIDPRLSCFSRKLRSPLYPILRKKKQRRMQTEDYGFHLGEEEDESNPGRSYKAARGPDK